MGTMTPVDWSQIISLAVRTLGQPAMWLSYTGSHDDEVKKAVPWLPDLLRLQLIADTSLLLTFTDEADRDRYFWATVGDDGPTKTNPYEGPARVYACTYAPDGTVLNENT